MSEGSSDGDPNSDGATSGRRNEPQPTGGRPRPLTMLALGMALGVAALGLTIVLMRFGQVPQTEPDTQVTEIPAAASEILSENDTVDVYARVDV